MRSIAAPPVSETLAAVAETFEKYRTTGVSLEPLAVSLIWTAISSLVAPCRSLEAEAALLAEIRAGAARAAMPASAPAAGPVEMPAVPSNLVPLRPKASRRIPITTQGDGGRA